MIDDGRAVLILGGTNPENVAGRRADYRGKAKREFLLRLYDNYNVVDLFTASGDLGCLLAGRRDVMEGRGKSERKLPGTNEGVPQVLETWDQVGGNWMREEMIERFTDRLAELWAKSPDPQRAMQWAANRMVESGLSLDAPEPNQKPWAFARMLIADNPMAQDQLHAVKSQFHPEHIETAEELIEMILPNDHE